MTEICEFNYNSPIGNLIIKCSDKGCEKIAFAPRGEERGSFNTIAGAIKNWLDDYFAGNKPSVSGLNLALKGTDFQKKVWDQLLTIPYGETTVYSRISETVVGDKNSSRAVGGAIGANPVAIIVPCHRVVAKNGLGGYAWGIGIKEKLLAFEKKGKSLK